LKVKTAFHIVINGGLKGVKLDGKQWRAHGFAEQFLNIPLCGGASHQMNDGFGVVDGFKKWKPQNMIQVGMGENQVVVKIALLQSSRFPRRRMPDPASTMMISSFWVRISRQVVSPPYLNIFRA
jgi:hypothetical protein